jgi:alpha-L-rhamnosidase
MIVPGKRTSGTASPDWGTAMVQLPWYLYLYYGDSIMLQNFYPDMKVWVDYVQAKNKDGIIMHGLGDWCPPGGNENIDCPVSVSSSAYHILDLKIMAQSAKILGFENDFEYYDTLHKKSILSFNQHFLDTGKSTYGSQTADVMALEIGIVPESKKEDVAASVVKNIHEKYDGFINTGIFGISRLFKALAENGKEDEVYRLLTKNGENSFAFMWEHFDASTLWEVLPVRSFDDENLFFRSHSHPMQAGYDAWFYSGIAGINPTPENPGFQKIIFKPYLTNYLKSASGSYESPYGKIVSNWKSRDDNFIWEIEIPVNCSGEIYLPLKENIQNVIVNGNKVPISDLTTEEEHSGFLALGQFESGKYHIEIQ